MSEEKQVYQQPYWARLSNGKGVCVEATSLKEARAQAEKSGEVKRIDVLPYPADPRPNPKSDCPSFCYRPDQCIGRTACPQNISCTN